MSSAKPSPKPTKRTPNKSVKSVKGESGRSRQISTPTLHSTLAPSVLRPNPEKAGGQYGRKSVGLYPTISRTLLSRVINRHVSTVTGILNGRTKIDLELALKMAQAIGIPVEQLSNDLKQKQDEFQQSKQ
jgi:hypothetical protein